MGLSLGSFVASGFQCPLDICQSSETETVFLKSLCGDRGSYCSGTEEVTTRQEGQKVRSLLTFPKKMLSLAQEWGGALGWSWARAWPATEMESQTECHNPTWGQCLAQDCGQGLAPVLEVGGWFGVQVFGLGPRLGLSLQYGQGRYKARPGGIS